VGVNDEPVQSRIFFSQQQRRVPPRPSAPEAGDASAGDASAGDASAGRGGGGAQDGGDASEERGGGGRQGARPVALIIYEWPAMRDMNGDADRARQLAGALEVHTLHTLHT